MTCLIAHNMGEMANKDDAGVDQPGDKNIITVDDKTGFEHVMGAELKEKENKLKNDIIIGGDETRKENESVTSTTNSKKLRFGIEAILKVKSDVTDHLAKRNSEHVEKDLANFNDGDNNDTNIYNDDNDDDDDDNDDDSGDYLTVDNLYETGDKCFTYVRLPPSLHGMHSQELSMMTPPSGLTMGTLSSPWAASLVNDVRKERFTPIRRIGHPYQNRTPPKRKKPRTSFTRLQILELEKRFERQKYLASTERSTLAKSLKMSDAQVKTWFQNRRTKWRRQTAEERELERQAANRLLFSIQSDPTNRKSMLISGERMCLSHLQRLPESRPTDI